jgi:hypothetical protein
MNLHANESLLNGKSNFKQNEQIFTKFFVSNFYLLIVELVVEYLFFDF